MGTVSRSRLLVALASVFTGLTVFVAVLGFAYSPVAFVPATAFGIVTYFLWYHASGRLTARVSQQARTTRRDTEAGGFGGGPREEWTGPQSGRQTNAHQHEPVQQRTSLSTTEAYRTLGLDPSADDATVKAAYREKVKEVHPDTEDGDERAFKRVQDAYERLSE